MSTELVVANTSLDFAIAAWLDAKMNRSRSEKTMYEYAATLRSYRASCQAVGLDLDSDARALSLVAQSWAGTSQRKQHVAASTYNQRLAIVSSFYAYCIKHEMVNTTNPVQVVDRAPVQAYAGAMPLTATNVQQALRKIDRSSSLGMRDYALLSVALHTGRRVSELVNMRWADVVVSGQDVLVTFPRTKGGKTMRDMLPPAVGKTLLSYRDVMFPGGVAAETPVWLSFAKNGHRGEALGVRGVERMCQKRLGISKSHVLRHTFAHNLEVAGAKVSDIQRYLGHSSLDTTGRYLNAMRNDANPHAKTLSAMFGIEE